MPGFIKTPADEKKWIEAKKSAGKQAKAGTSKYWRLANYIWHQMDKTKAAARMESAKSGIDTKNRAGGPEDVADVAKWLKDTETERLAADGRGGYLVTEADGTKHLPTRKNGKVDHGLMGGAWAALHGGYRGNKYDGPGKQAAISKLKALYKSQGLKTPDEKEAASAVLVRLARSVLKTFAPPEGPPTARSTVAAAQPVRGTAACAVALAIAEGDTGSFEWVELIPGGKFSAVDGRGPFTNEDPNKIIRASVARMPQVGLVVDYDHSTDLSAPEGRPSPAGGWIKGFRVGDRGAIFARIEWTPRAADLLKNKEYRYISPVFEHSKDNEVECILRAALTNNPALIELPALASARTNSMDKAHEEVEEMTTEKLAKVFPRREGESLSSHLARLSRHAVAEEAHAEPDGDEAMNPPGSEPSDASDSEDIGYGEDMSQPEAESDNPPESPYHPETEEDMAKRHADEMARCAGEDEQNACRMKHMAEKKRFEARKNQGLEVEAGKHGSADDMDDDDDEAMRSRMAKRMQSRMSRRTPMTKAQIESMVAKHPMMLSLQNEFNKLRQEKAKDAATTRVDDAIKQGRLIPAQRNWAIAYCTADEKGFDTFIGHQPKIIQAGADGTFTARIGEPPKGTSSLSEKEVNIFANLGLESEEQLARCAAIKEKWTLKFPRPRLMLDDNSTAQNNEK